MKKIHKIKRAGIVSAVAISIFTGLLTNVVYASDSLPVINGINGANAQYSNGNSYSAGSDLSSTLNAANNSNTLNIKMDVNSNISDIKYDYYNVGAGKTVNYEFTKNGQVSVNRVTQAGQAYASKIYGDITSSGANGSVYLINPNGLVIDGNIAINAGSFVASTLNLNDSDIAKILNNNELVLSRGSLTPEKILIKNGATIYASSGLAFASNSITNNGTILSSGNVQFVTGDGVLFNLQENKIPELAKSENITPMDFDSLPLDYYFKTEMGAIKTDGGLVSAKNILFSSNINKQYLMDSFHVDINTPIFANEIAGEGGNIYIYADNKQLIDPSIPKSAVNVNNALTAANNIDIKADWIEVGNPFDPTIQLPPVIISKNLNIDTDYIGLNNSNIGIFEDAIIKAKAINFADGSLIANNSITLNFKENYSTQFMNSLSNNSLVKADTLKLFSLNTDFDVDDELNGNSNKFNFNNLLISAKTDINISDKLVANGKISLIQQDNSFTLNEAKENKIVSNDIFINSPDFNLDSLIQAQNKQFTIQSGSFLPLNNGFLNTIGDVSLINTANGIAVTDQLVDAFGAGNLEITSNMIYTNKGTELPNVMKISGNITTSGRNLALNNYTDPKPPTPIHILHNFIYENGSTINTGGGTLNIMADTYDYSNAATQFGDGRIINAKNIIKPFVPENNNNLLVSQQTRPEINRLFNNLQLNAPTPVGENILVNVGNLNLSVLPNYPTIIEGEVDRNSRPGLIAGTNYLEPLLGQDLIPVGAAAQPSMLDENEGILDLVIRTPILGRNKK